ncbi:MAG: DNA methyltransferase [Thermoguttaceae bacterium]|jgi:putative DNA methylase
MKRRKTSLIETDAFPFEFISGLAARESWRKEVHRPVYHIHKWWAKRLGSVFRGILLGCALPEGADLPDEFYRVHSLRGLTVFDPFMGSGTTIGEAHKLGLTAFGRDINPVAAELVRVSLGPMDARRIKQSFSALADGVGKTIRSIYTAKDSQGRPCEVLYYFWVMQVPCPECRRAVDLFRSCVVARNAYPNRKPEIQILCPSCGDVFRGLNAQRSVVCRSCGHGFNPEQGTTRGREAICPNCPEPFNIIEALAGARPAFRLYAKLVLTQDGRKEYLPATAEDHTAYAKCSKRLQIELTSGRILLPDLRLGMGYNTRQAMGYGFAAWRDFFNDRQLLALGLLQSAIGEIADEPTRDALLLLFSGVLEFNNLFASYKGEGTGAVRHMFSHHILKPERTPIEANVWGTPKSSGSFTNLFRSRLLRAIGYRLAPVEVNGPARESGRICAPPFSGEVDTRWPRNGNLSQRAVYLSCGDSSETGLPDSSIDLVLTDPPFFDNVHYSELADFFYSWQQLIPRGFARKNKTTRSPSEVQDSDADSFSTKLQGVFKECRRVLKGDGLLVFTYHHSRDDGWISLVNAILGAGFVVVNSHPVKSEMSVATPKSQAKEPIQLDIIIVCHKGSRAKRPIPVAKAVESSRSQAERLRAAGLKLSRNDRKAILFGQLLETIRRPEDASEIAERVKAELDGRLMQATLF